MNKNWTLTILATSLLSQLPLQAWSTGNNPPQETPVDNDNFPFAPTQEWYTEESYLLMKPYMENMIFGNTDTFTQETPSNFSNKIKVKQPEFEWSSGARVTVGRYLPNHDLWDIGLTGTFFYTDTDDSADANPAGGVGFNPSFISSPANEGSFNWRLNYWTVDLLVGRLFDMSETTVFHPYVGVRGSFQYQHASGKTSITNTSGQVPVLSTVKTSIDNDFWGVGPRVGTAFIYYFEKHFSLLANISTSLLVGGQHLKSNNTNAAFTVVGNIPEQNSTKIKSNDSIGVIRSHVEASLGIGWESWLKNNTVRIAPSINFEGALWFDMNQLYNIYADGGLINVEQRRHGNLGLMGVSFNLQVDF